MERLQRNGGELMKLTMLGTGNALVTECYNTCFVVQNGKNICLWMAAEEILCWLS